MAISRCRYFWCPKCKLVYEKEKLLKQWKMVLLMEVASFNVAGTRTCSCGKVFSVQDIYTGLYDLPKEYWNRMEQPVEL